MISHDLSPAYPIAIHLQNIRNTSEAVTDADMENFRSLQMNNFLSDVLDIMPEKYMGELAQYLIVFDIELPDVFKKRLVSLKQVSHVVGCYLTEQVQDVIGAIKFVTSDPVAIKILVETDVNLAVCLLEIAALAGETFGDLLGEKKDALQQFKRSGAIRNRNFNAQSPSNFAGLAGIQNALGDQGDTCQLILEEEPNTGEQQTAEIERDIRKFTTNVDVLQKGQATIKAEI